MKRGILKFDTCIMDGHADTFRTIFKTQHGRVLYLLLEINGTDCTILDCFYIDRNQNKAGAERYNCKPSKLQTFQFKAEKLLSVVEKELDKKYYSVEFVPSEQDELSMEEYLQWKVEDERKKYSFLVMVGDGESYGGLPVRLRTRLKNRLHRSVYIELKYYKEGKGVVHQCYYYDRRYRRQDVKVTPPQLVSCFFPSSHKGILNLLNQEICCDFTHMVVTNEIDVDSNMTPLCGAL